MKSLIVIPTFNEKDNIANIISAVLEKNPQVHVLVVDDNSPDGTSDVVKKVSENNGQVQLLLRQSKEGLGRAYVAGFEWGLERNFDVIVEMDADFSHRPIDLVNIIAAMKENDFVVGSRYVPGGATANWGIIRKLISRAGGIYSRLILGFPINDWTGGFNAWSAETLRSIDLQSIKSNGYSFQIELKYRALRIGKKGHEVPILFEDRRAGQSKMSSKIVFEALYRVVLLRLN